MKKRTQSYPQQTYDKALYDACCAGDIEAVRRALEAHGATYTPLSI